MPVFVKSHKRGKATVSAHTRRRWGGRYNPGRLQELQMRLDHSMSTRRTLTGQRKRQIDRTIKRLDNIYEQQRITALNYSAGFATRVQRATTAGNRARRIQAYRSEILGRRW